MGKKMFKTINGGVFPTRGSKNSACVDLYANEDVSIAGGGTMKIPLGVCLNYEKFPLCIKNNIKSFYLQLEPRSSLRASGAVAGTGIIDIDFKGELMIVLHNTRNKG
jgi:dUTPase